MDIVIIIPARLQSTRLPEKMLSDIHGLPLIVRTYEQALLSKLASDVVVATDSPKILDVLLSHHCKAVLTPENIQTGSDRIAIVAQDLEAEIVINVQGDEPLIPPEMIDQAIAPFLENTATSCTTLVKRMNLEDPSVNNPNVVKVAVDQKMNALYFSRSPIPFPRVTDDLFYYRHIGLYGYRKETLMAFTTWPKSRLEKAESLEQLRLLEHGIKIKCVETELNSQAVDTQEDLELVRALSKH